MSAPTPSPDFFSPQVRTARRFYLDLAPKPDEPLVVVCGGLEHCAADYAIHRESFAYYSIEFVARGRGTLRLAGQTYTLCGGTLFVYGPGVAQDITTDADEPLCKYFVDFAGSRAEELLAQFAAPPGSVGRVFAPGEIQQVFDDLIANGLRAGALSGRLCSVLLEYLIVKTAESRMPWEAAQTPAFDTYQRCRQYIQEHYPRLRTLEQAARQCHVDPAYLCRLFRKYAHQSPYQFLMRLKMNLAAERLQHPGNLVKQVAAELGFEDPFHFSRTFKKTFGLSPDAFRRLR